MLALAAWVCWTLVHRWLFGTAGRPQAAEDKLTRDDWLCMAVIAILSFFSVVLWTGLEQAGGTMTLFADEKTDMTVLGWTLPASYFQSLNPLIIILFALPLSVFWGWLDRRYPISAAAKQGSGLVIAGLGFAVMATAEQLAGSVGKVSPLWLTAVYALHTLGEMCSFPVGTALVNQISPRRYLSRMMAVWLASGAAAGYLAGTLEDRLKTLESVLSLPQFLFLSMVGAGIVLLLLSPILRRMCSGRM
jgi:POT family proton-dependent oligopeptide transporter